MLLAATLSVTAFTGCAINKTATVATLDKAILDLILPSEHGSTFGGSPLAAAVGIAALEVIEEEKLSERAFTLGKYFMDHLSEINSPNIKGNPRKRLAYRRRIETRSRRRAPFLQVAPKRRHSGERNAYACHPLRASAGNRAGNARLGASQDYRNIATSLESRGSMNRFAKIVATLSPSGSDESTLRGLIEAGMDVARLNFSHGTHRRARGESEAAAQTL